MKFRINSQEHRKQQTATHSHPITEHAIIGEDKSSFDLSRSRTCFGNAVEEQFYISERPPSKKHVVQNFFRTLRPKDSAIDIDTAYNMDERSAPRLVGRGREVCCDHHKNQNLCTKIYPVQNRSSAIPMVYKKPSFDTNEDMLERLMGRPKEPHIVKSDTFVFSQHVRVSPRVAPVAPPPPSPPAQSPVEQDGKPICRQELEAIFRGAPYFSTDIETLRPRVAYREDGEKMVVERRLDCKGPWETNLPASSTPFEGLLSMGLDAGTVGLEDFLRLPIADTVESRSQEVRSRAESWRLLIEEPAKLGLRVVDTHVLVKRLTALDVLHTQSGSSKESKHKRSKSDSSETCDKQQKAYHGQAWSEDMIEEMGQQLFTVLLNPNQGVPSAGINGGGLKSQIHALEEVLIQEHLWYDFSKDDMKLHVGQILFGEDELEFVEDQPNDRDLLLLQITLAAELLIRLQAIQRSEQEHIFTCAELLSLQTQRTTKVAWDLLLAERFLINLTLSSLPKLNNSIYGAVETTSQSTRPILKFKNCESQRAALLHFASTIEWPYVEDVKMHVADISSPGEFFVPESGFLSPVRATTRPISSESVYYTPPSSPSLPALSPRISIHGEESLHTSAAKQRPDHEQPNGSASRMAASTLPNMDPSRVEIKPWLSQYWLSGLVLPGEAASGLLMGTLLECSPCAPWSLGHLADLHGGFTLKTQAFWSKQSVIGRVLAAGEGVKECMDWISIPSSLLAAPRNGWVNIKAQTVARRHIEPRFRAEDVVSKASDPLHGEAATSVRARDFATPIDSSPLMGNEVHVDGVSFTNPAFGQATAQLSFSSPINVKVAPVVLPLAHSVHFVASYPCQPPPPLPSPMSLTRSLTGSLDISSIQTQSTAILLASKATPSAPPTRSPTARSQTSAGLTVAAPSPTLRTARSVHGLALRSQPNPFYNSASPPPQTDPARASQCPPASIRLSPPKSKSTSPTSMRKPNLQLGDKQSPRRIPAAHPLHIGHRYTILPAATILTSSLTPLESRVRSSADQPPDVECEREILVLDCQGCSDLELLARAWCSMVGEHAIVGKSGRTCLACCIREAKGLGIGVVIRTG